LPGFRKEAAEGVPEGAMDSVVTAGRAYLVCRSLLRSGRDKSILNEELLAILYSRKLI